MALGVFEKVEVNDPVTWILQMVLVAKSDSKPRCTVNIQMLNKHVYMQTHDMEELFCQAIKVIHHKKGNGGQLEQVALGTNRKERLTQDDICNTIWQV